MNEPSREDLIELRFEHNMTREDIAERYGVSTATVRRWIRDFDIPRPRSSRKNRDGSVTPIGELIAEPDDGFTVLERAQLVLGPRLLERPGYGYYLDGRPAHIDRIIEAAEQARAEK